MVATPISVDVKHNSPRIENDGCCPLVENLVVFGNAAAMTKNYVEALAW